MIGTFLSFLFVVPRVARLHGTELAVSAGRVGARGLPEDPPEQDGADGPGGELFFGAAPE